jgi:glycosyltransferase involved in cell wall biosynthesis
MKNNPMVSVAFMGYNHERFVSQALDSVLNQQCSFSFEIVVGEDCSKDRTRQIILQYQQRFPNIIKVLPEAPNKKVLKNWRDVLKACSGKYIAVCHADDFWHDPLKLQKQITFMEQNPEYGFTHTNANYLLEKKGVTIENFNSVHQKEKIRDGFVFEELLASRFFITTVTACFRRSLIEEKVNFDEFIRAGFTYEDLATWLELSRHTKFKYLDDISATYRIMEDSVSRSKDPLKKFAFLHAHYRVKSFFIKKYHVRKELVEEFEKNYHQVKFNMAYNLKQREEAIESFEYLKGRRLVNSKMYMKKLVLHSPFMYKSIATFKKIFRPVNRLAETG